ncbi:hypothetical protein [Vibrio phage RYC]|nr:hypothetical protein [Vibrio phage RYC]
MIRLRIKKDTFLNGVERFTIQRNVLFFFWEDYEEYVPIDTEFFDEDDFDIKKLVYYDLASAIEGMDRLYEKLNGNIVKKTEYLYKKEDT